MPKKIKTEETIVTGKDYLRSVPESFLESALSNNASITPILELWSTPNTGYNTPFSNSERNVYVVHGCKEGNGKPQKITIKNYYDKSTNCAYCKRPIYNGYHCPIITTKENCKNSQHNTSYKLKSFLFISQKEGEEDTTLIRLIDTTITYEKDETKKGSYYIKSTADVKAALEVIPGVSVKGYRVLKKSIKEANAFEAMNINTQTINSTWTRSFAYADSTCFEEYLQKHKIFSERTGIKAALKYFPNDMRRISNDPYMILHLCMISEYPILEALVKIGYSKLYFDLIKSFYDAQSKTEILLKVKDYQKLFNTSSKGSTGLRIPAYIGDYLKTKGAPISEYLIWCNIYELQPMSKEQFNKYIDSTEILPLLSTRATGILPNIIKYGYTVEQVTKYLFKQSLFYRRKDVNYDVSHVANFMHDYLTMCEYLDVTPNKFPPDIKQSHDEIQKLKRTSTSVDVITKIKNIGESTQTLLDGFIDPDNLTKMEEKYFIKVPQTEADFIEEGNLQNNCVGHYTRQVSKGDCIVFFVRKKDEPNSSYVTAEYNCYTEKLGQCMYANNRVVEDEDLLNYCKVACSRIKTGILSGKIA